MAAQPTPVPALPGDCRSGGLPFEWEPAFGDDTDCAMKVAAIVAAVVVTIGLVAYVGWWVLGRFKGNKN